MSNNIYTAPVYKLKELNNLFVELTSKVCNQKCAKCYIEFPAFKKIKDFISLDKIKEALNGLNEDIWINSIDLGLSKGLKLLNMKNMI